MHNLYLTHWLWPFRSTLLASNLKNKYWSSETNGNKHGQCWNKLHINSGNGPLYSADAELNDKFALSTNQLILTVKVKWTSKDTKRVVIYETCIVQISIHYWCKYFFLLYLLLLYFIAICGWKLRLINFFISLTFYYCYRY